MKKFNYQFDSVLKVKESFKKEAMKEVAVVGKEIEETTAKKEELILELKDCKQNSRKTSMKIAEIQFIESHMYLIEKKIQFIEDELSRLKLLQKMKQNELIEKTKESKIFHKLKESKMLLHKQDENKEEMKMIDELAIQKMSRN
jgi:flagellar export protein FliJ